MSPKKKLSIKWKNIPSDPHIIMKYKLQCLNEYLSEGWKILWIYKKPFILENIKKLPGKPKTIYDHWVLSKAFSFPDETIEEFINNYSLLNSV